MRRRQQLLLISLSGAAVIMALVLALALVTHLMANRDVVRNFIVAKTDRTIGARLVYDRLEVGFLPLPHLKARGIQLQRQDRFEIRARELQVYPRILPILKGDLSVGRLALMEPSATLHVHGAAPSPVNRPPEEPPRDLENRLGSAIGALFDALAVVDPHTSLRIEEGSLNLIRDEGPEIRISAVDAQAANEDGRLSLSIDCRSDLTGPLAFSATADIDSRRADGRIDIADINLRKLLHGVDLPGGIAVLDTRTAVGATISINGPAALQGRFEIDFPSLTIARRERQLTLGSVAVTGSFDYARSRLSLTVDDLQCAQPPLALSANASMAAGGADGRSVVRVDATAGQLEVSVAERIAGGIAGDMEAIRTAFSIARGGTLDNAAFSAEFNVDPDGWHRTAMQASGHLSNGMVALPDIDADLEEIEGDIHFKDQRVDFTAVKGRFEGISFERVDAAIDWTEAAALTIASPAAVVDAATFYDWLTSFDGVAPIKKQVSALDGRLRLSTLDIRGPLAEPADWRFRISGTPEDLRLSSPKLPFATRFDGGRITYVPGEERAEGVTVTFLDASLLAGAQSKGIAEPEAVDIQLDGSLGSDAVAWLGTSLPIPEHLKMKPPVDLTGIRIGWTDARTFAFQGTMKTAGGVDLDADLTLSPDDWHLRRLRFSDGSSQVNASARQSADSLTLDFSGNVEKATADRILADNRTLSGGLEGDFQVVVDSRNPMNSAFTGKLSGRGLHLRALLPDTVDIDHFAVEGSGDRMRIAPARLTWRESHLEVAGVVASGEGGLTVDLQVDADKLDADAIRTLGNVSPDDGGSDAPSEGGPSMMAPKGKIHLNVAEFSYDRFNWSPVEAEMRLNGKTMDIRIDRADLCGIATTGNIALSPDGVNVQIDPSASDASLQATADCLLTRPIRADARYDLSGRITLPATRTDPIRAMTGRVEFSSRNGKIIHGNILMKILSVLNLTEVFAGAGSDLAEKGYGYETAHVAADIGDGKMMFEEILFDGKSLKITGQGRIDLVDRMVDVTLLAAPLKTVDRIVNKIPVISYIAGGSLVSIPLHLKGKMDNLTVVPMAPSAVGKGLLNIMGRTLKAPFKLVEGAAEFASEAGGATNQPPTDTRQKGP